MKKKVILLLVLIVLALVGCGEKDSIGSNYKKMPSQHIINQTNDWRRIETSLKDCEKEEVAEIFMKWIIGRLNAKDWEVLIEWADYLDKRLLNSAIEFGTLIGNENDKDIVLIDSSYWYLEETGEIIGWQATYSNSVFPEKRLEEYSGAFFVYKKDGEWTWSLIPFSLKSDEDIIIQ